MTTLSDVRPDPVDLAQALLACPTVTPEEGGALALIEEILAPRGFAVHRPVFREADTPDVENLFAAIGGGSRHLVFAGHTDVVPPGDLAAWRHPPFAAALEDGLLYGRGAVDMKGGIAAFLAAALDFLADHGPDFDGRISFLITGDEEGPSVNGTVKLLAWAKERGERFSGAIVGEPTNPRALGDQIKIGRRGSLSGIITLRGVQGHVAYPHLADNPLRALPAVLTALMDPPLDAGTADFQPSNLEVTSAETDTKVVNVIPAKVELRFNVRFNDLWTADSLKAEIAARLARAADLPSLRREGLGPIETGLVFLPVVSDVFLTQAPDLVQTLSAAVARVTGRTPELGTGGGTSDARFIKDYCPVVEFGLVGDTMHQIDERVPVQDLRTLAAIYRQFLEDYFA
ncbi:succinyl-diaminopimelate desuccinylase [Methylobrevis pamukkalensis]|uniref:Succinyl-diaminopimelate desuccinylase n=1 Tax=Methylobrevis pamukkalensis TaxID=1439726 RepID=A0A1E3H2G2_9HYPH|nr:succinyl-diaminopimelate desuccinylase [Methylobrevis pamukkalensis]ODN70345.1 Succinyl-diaminopimelate desuccinylase [Methylobrevis pamukkalensis]